MLVIATAAWRNNAGDEAKDGLRKEIHKRNSINALSHSNTRPMQGRVFILLHYLTSALHLAATIPYFPEGEALPGKHDLVLLLTGDTQYHFKCELQNVECKKASTHCRLSKGLDQNFRPVRSSSRDDESWQRARTECVRIESRFANRVQRRALERLISALPYNPAALIINGDLTDFGHMEQFNEFQSGWMRDFPVPILAGLGNHDYENNVDDCLLNFCAHTLLTWFTEYGQNNSLVMDYTRLAKNSFDIEYTGSFAYSTRVCSIAGKNCAHVIQLNNALDYKTQFTSVLVKWKITSTIEWLKRQLKLLEDTRLPILINVHQNEGVRAEKMKEFIGDWLYARRHEPKPPRVAVFFAHMHGLHEVRSFCLHGVTVPFVYVGSVPNNRFTALKVTSESATLYGYSAKSNGPALLSHLENLWTNCSQSSVHYFDKYEPNSIVP